MDDEALLTLALQTFGESWATSGIEPKVRSPEYDRGFARTICRLAFEKSGADVERYRAALHDFIALSEEFVVLQMELDRTGRYRHSSFEEVRREVYDNPEVMERRYLNGLLLSQAFWANHSKIRAYFVDRFCEGNPPTGTVLEVPSGTGIFISEFARRNPRWSAFGVDLSDSSVAFSRDIVRLVGVPAVTVAQQDIFDLPSAGQYDRIICGELLEHLEDPAALLRKLAALITGTGKLFVTTAIWAANIDHIYLFSSVREVRAMLEQFFTIESELALNIREAQQPDDERAAINYACVLSAPAAHPPP
jgi:2-polyprenyl-3-methyl-5-hydroxy-6-metoxy-1,4-benzoquinol methylase